MAVAVWAVNTWLWQPCLGGLIIGETAERQGAACKASDKPLKEAHGGCKGDPA